LYLGEPLRFAPSVLARVGLSAPSPSGVHFIHALRWFRYYPSRCGFAKNSKQKKGKS
jgi:hypothetical protein